MTRCPYCAFEARDREEELAHLRAYPEHGRVVALKKPQADPAERLRDLTLDWDFYTLQIADVKQRDRMRRAVLAEMRALIAELSAECGEGPH